MTWPSFKHADKVYDLAHLHPRILRFELPAEGKNPSKRYDVKVLFGLHCFTRGLRSGEAVDPALSIQTVMKPGYLTRTDMNTRWDCWSSFSLCLQRGRITMAAEATFCCGGSRKGWANGRV